MSASDVKPKDLAKNSAPSPYRLPLPIPRLKIETLLDPVEMNHRPVVSIEFYYMYIVEYVTIFLVF
jgi:hypothetical protein